MPVPDQLLPPFVEVEVVRRPDRRAAYRQELLLDTPDLKMTLQIIDASSAPVPVADAALDPGAALLWYTFPGRYYEIGAFHEPDGRLLGHYTNIISPIEYGPDRWRVDDLFLDVWVPAGGQPRLLDRDELADARSRGWLDEAEAERAVSVAAEIMIRARGRWPPAEVRRWPLELVPALRMRRDRPGDYWANVVSGRLIAYGLYLFGVVSAISVGFGAFTDALTTPGPWQTAWMLMLGATAVTLVPLCLTGRLPATRWPEPAITDERTLFVGVLATGLAVLGLNPRDEWAGALAVIYGVLVAFLMIFGFCRAWFDRQVPGFAIAGLLVSAIALYLLL